MARQLMSLLPVRAYVDEERLLICYASYSYFDAAADTCHYAAITLHERYVDDMAPRVALLLRRCCC